MSFFFCCFATAFECRKGAFENSGLFIYWVLITSSAAAAAKSPPQPCPTLCNPRDGSPPGSPIPGILQARTLGWVAISFSNAWKWKWSLSVMSDPQQPQGLQPTRLLHPWDFPGRSTGVTWVQLCDSLSILWHWNENWPFPLLWPLLSFPNLLAYWVQHFHSIIFQDLK